MLGCIVTNWKLPRRRGLLTNLFVSPSPDFLQHAKRLYPLQVSAKKPIEWGYYNDGDDQWKVVDKAILNDNTVEGLEKMVGFEGRPDPASGFYCVYDGGRLKLGDESSFK
ncbi:MAG: hypothetical protein SGARI_006711 [Bacillariaceae sp.]